MCFEVTSRFACRSFNREPQMCALCTNPVATAPRSQTSDAHACGSRLNEELNSERLLSMLLVNHESQAGSLRHFPGIIATPAGIDARKCMRSSKNESTAGARDAEHSPQDHPSYSVRGATGYNAATRYSGRRARLNDCPVGPCLPCVASSMAIGTTSSGSLTHSLAIAVCG